MDYHLPPPPDLLVVGGGGHCGNPFISNSIQNIPSLGMVLLLLAHDPHFDGVVVLISHSCHKALNFQPHSDSLTFIFCLVIKVRQEDKQTQSYDFNIYESPEKNPGSVNLLGNDFPNLLVVSTRDGIPPCPTLLVLSVLWVGYRPVLHYSCCQYSGWDTALSYTTPVVSTLGGILPLYWILWTPNNPPQSSVIIPLDCECQSFVTRLNQ